MDDHSVPGQAGETDTDGPFAPGQPGQADAAQPVPMTGESRVDAALRLLERLPGLPVSAHPELFEQVHAQLSEVLSELESESAGPSGRPES